MAVFRVSCGHRGCRRRRDPSGRLLDCGELLPVSATTLAHLDLGSSGFGGSGGSHQGGTGSGLRLALGDGANGLGVLPCLVGGRAALPGSICLRGVASGSQLLLASCLLIEAERLVHFDVFVHVRRFEGRR